MELADDYGTPDRLPPKPYLREGLRLEALVMLTELDVRTESHEPRWAKTSFADSVFGWQFNLDFHPTRRKFVDDDPRKPGRENITVPATGPPTRTAPPSPARPRPVKMEGLLGASKNLGVSSMVQSALRLHGQLMHAGTAAATVAAVSLREGIERARGRRLAGNTSPRCSASSYAGRAGPARSSGPWHDVHPEDRHFEARNLLTLAGIWRPDPESVSSSRGVP